MQEGKQGKSLMEMEQNISMMRLNINDIIYTKDESIERIEFILDNLIEYSAEGIGEDEFRQLNRYYSTFNPENSQTYDRFYADRNR